MNPLRWLHTPGELDAFVPRVENSVAPACYFESLERAGADADSFERQWPQDNLVVRSAVTHPDRSCPPTPDRASRFGAMIQLSAGERLLASFESQVVIEVESPVLTQRVQALQANLHDPAASTELLIVAASMAGAMWGRWCAEGFVPAPGVLIDTVAHASSAPEEGGDIIQALQAALWDSYLEYALSRLDCEDAREALTFEPKGGVSALSTTERQRAIWLQNLAIRAPNRKTAQRVLAQKGRKAMGIPAGGGGRLH